MQLPREPHNLLVIKAVERILRHNIAESPGRLGISPEQLKERCTFLMDRASALKKRPSQRAG